MKTLDAATLRQHKGKSFVGVSTAVGICNNDGQLFMAQRSVNTRDEHGRWDVCGGGLKFNVTIEDNIRREMQEEFAVESNEELYFIGIREAFRTDQLGDKTHWIALDYLLVLTVEEAAKVHINEPEMFDNSGWFSLDDLPSPLHSVISEEYIQRLKSKLLQLIS